MRSIVCTACKHDNAAWRKHCGGCGSGLPGGCASCGAVNEATDRFCGGCGKPLRRTAPAKAPVEGTIPIDVVKDVLPDS